MGCIKALAQTFRDFATNHVEEPDVPAVADVDNGCAKSMKIALLLLKEEINKPLRKLEDYLNEIPGILGGLILMNLLITPLSACGTVNSQ